MKKYSYWMYCLLISIPCALADPAPLFKQHCASCHGADLKGGLGVSLVDGQWLHGQEAASLQAVIQKGVNDKGMPAFGAALSEVDIKALADYILAQANSASGTLPTINSWPKILDTLDYQINVELIDNTLETPWAIAFLDAKQLLITERPGRLVILNAQTGAKTAINGIPSILPGLAENITVQGGLLDVTLDPDYAQNGWIYLVYSDLKNTPERSMMTKVIRGQLKQNNWVNSQVVFETPEKGYAKTPGFHFGGRVVVDKQGFVYVSVGDRFLKEQAQDTQLPNGKIHRVTRDGKIPQDNPFLKVKNALPSLYSIGHRNPQGLAIHPVTGDVWALEHGPKGGDELNLIKAGVNYGWPLVTYGIDYDGKPISLLQKMPGMQEPIYYWRPSIATSGLAFYVGDMFPLWQHKALVSSLKNQALHVLDIAENRVLHDEIIVSDLGHIREAVPAPDGSIYLVTNKPNQILRLTALQARRL